MYLNISSRVVRGDNLQLVRWPSSHSLDVQIDESFILSFILFYIEQEVGFENEQGGQIFCLTNQRESSKWAATGQESLLYLVKPNKSGQTSDLSPISPAVQAWGYLSGKPRCAKMDEF